jgi:hypothetical protein
MSVSDKKIINKLRFLGAFAKQWKATVKALSCPSVRVEQLGSHWMNIRVNLYVSILPKIVEKIKVSLKSDKNNGYFTWRRVYIYNTLQLFSEWEMFQAKAVERVKTLFFFFRKVVPCMKSWGKIWYSRTGHYDNIVRRMRYACWITKTTDAHPEYVKLVAFPRQQWLRNGVAVLR